MYYTWEVIVSARNSREAVEVLLWWAKLITAHSETAALMELPVPQDRGCSAVAIILWEGGLERHSSGAYSRKKMKHIQSYLPGTLQHITGAALTPLSMCQVLSSHVQIKSSSVEELSQSQKCAKSLGGCPVQAPGLPGDVWKVCSVNNPFLR